MAQARLLLSVQRFTPQVGGQLVPGITTTTLYSTEQLAPDKYRQVQEVFLHAKAFFQHESKTYLVYWKKGTPENIDVTAVWNYIQSAPHKPVPNGLAMLSTGTLFCSIQVAYFPNNINRSVVLSGNYIDEETNMLRLLPIVRPRVYAVGLPGKEELLELTRDELYWMAFVQYIYPTKSWSKNKMAAYILEQLTERNYVETSETLPVIIDIPESADNTKYFSDITYVLGQVHSDMNLSQTALQFLANMLEWLSNKMAGPVRQLGVVDAVKQLFPGELSKHALVEIEKTKEEKSAFQTTIFEDKYSPETAGAMAIVLEYILAEILVLSGRHLYPQGYGAKGRSKITPYDVLASINNDNELLALFRRYLNRKWYEQLHTVMATTLTTMPRELITLITAYV